MRFVSLAPASFAAVFAVACAVPSDPGETNEPAAENVEQTQQGLMNNGTGLLGSVCRACGCSWVARQIDGCTVYRCECDTQKQAECVINAPGGGSAITTGTTGTTTGSFYTPTTTLSLSP